MKIYATVVLLTTVLFGSLVGCTHPASPDESADLFASQTAQTAPARPNAATIAGKMISPVTH